MVPVDDLTNLRADLRRAQEDLAAMTRMVAELQTRIKDAEAAQAEVEGAYRGYHELSARIQQRLAEAKQAIAQRREMAASAVVGTTDEIDERISEIDGHLDAQKDELEDSRRETEMARRDLDSATQDALEKERAYAALKGAPKSMEAAVNRIHGLLDQSQAAQQRGDVVATYFLLDEARRIASNLAVPEGDEYRASLETAYGALRQARARVIANKTSADQANVAHIARKAAFDAAHATRQAKILEALRAVKVPVQRTREPTPARGTEEATRAP